MNEGCPVEFANVKFTALVRTVPGTAYATSQFKFVLERKQFCVDPISGRGLTVKQVAYMPNSVVFSWKQWHHSSGKERDCLYQPVHEDINCKPWVSRYTTMAQNKKSFVREIFTPAKPWSQKEMS